MKKLIENYTFDASAGTIAFDDYANIYLERILIITNVTAGVIIFIASNPLKTGTVLTNVVTLTHDTVAMNDGDALFVLYEDVIAAQYVDGAVTALLDTSDFPVHGDPDAVPPVKIGGKASASPPAAVDDGDMVNTYHDLQGRIVTQAEPPKASTSSVTSVAGNAGNVTLLAANTGRLGATIYNDSTAILYLKLGVTASATSFTSKIQPESYYEVPFNYIGIIDGIWASAVGNARITEVSA
jgi:hypothetical protein